MPLEPPASAAVNTATPLLTVTYDDADSGVDLATFQVRLDGVDATQRFTVTAAQASLLAAFTDGPHRLDASLQDHAGNTAQVTSHFTIDTVPPVPLSPGTLTVGPVTNGQVTVSGAPGSVEPGARVRLTNTRTGQAVLVVATAGGSFTTTLMVQSGD